MPINDSWDWPLLLYIGTVILKRTEAQFWRMTPRKLNALTRAHITMNPTGNDKGKGKQAKPGYIDQIF